jgi:3,4-dihydroxyphenylacetate 2,3-dioxygenase
MGKIVGAALVSHQPVLMQCEEFRVLMGAGADSDLIAGCARLRQKITAAQPNVVMIFDGHWFTTGYHLIDAGARDSGSCVSDEMPWYLHGVPYDYAGHPALARLVEDVARERGVRSRAIAHTGLGRRYPTINLLKQLLLENTPIVLVSSC